MRLKFGVEIMDMGEEQVAVPIGDNKNFNGILRMNNTTAAIIELLKEDTTEEQIVASLLKDYDADEETIRRNVQKVLLTLQQENLLNE